MAWQRLFASQKPEVGNRDLIMATLFAPIIYFALYLIPIAVTVFLIPLVFMPLFALAILVTSRNTDLNQPMFEDLPREHPAFIFKRSRTTGEARSASARSRSHAASSDPSPWRPPKSAPM